MAAVAAARRVATNASLSGELTLHYKRDLADEIDIQHDVARGWRGRGLRIRAQNSGERRIVQLSARVCKD